MVTQIQCHMHTT